MTRRGAVCGKAACTVLRGALGNCGTDEILWHRRETRRQQRKQTSSYATTEALGLLASGRLRCNSDEAPLRGRH